MLSLQVPIYLHEIKKGHKASWKNKKGTIMVSLWDGTTEQLRSDGRKIQWEPLPGFCPLERVEILLETQIQRQGINPDNLDPGTMYFVPQKGKKKICAYMDL